MKETRPKVTEFLISTEDLQIDFEERVKESFAEFSEQAIADIIRIVMDYEKE